MSTYLNACSTSVPINNGVTKTFGPVGLATMGTHIESIIYSDRNCTLTHKYVNGNGSSNRVRTFDVIAGTEHVFKSQREGKTLYVLVENDSGVNQTVLSLETFATDGHNGSVTIDCVVLTTEFHAPLEVQLHSGTFSADSYSATMDISACTMSTLIYKDSNTGIAAPVFVYVGSTDTSLALYSDLYPTSNAYHTDRTTSEYMDLRPFSYMALLNPHDSSLTDVLATLYSST